MNGASVETDIVSDQCVASGCRNRWTCDFGNGRLCSPHDRERYLGGSQRPLPVPVPTHAASRAFSEVAERDEEYVHDEPLPF